MRAHLLSVPAASRRTSRIGVLVPTCLLALAWLPGSARGQADGAALYDKWCAACHGVEGDGNGVAASTMLPRPRDFTSALYQVRTTATGELPTDADILRVIDEGMPGTAMPGWEEVLSRSERLALVEHLKSFSQFFANSPPPEPLEFGSAPRATEGRIAEGREVYDRIECFKCHGTEGRGDGTSSPTLEDDTEFPVIAADLTENWRFNGGGTVEDIYRTLSTGLDGTPMPNFRDLVDGGVITDDELWSLAHFVRSLSPERAPEVREVIVAERMEAGSLPASADDEHWNEVDRFYVPLVGQIVVAPRRFDPRVDGLWVQALHDGEELALLLSWTDPSNSPDPAWAEFAGWITSTIYSGDEGSWTGPAGPDGVTVQFPQTLPSGMERPFFLQGDARRPAYLWSWRSDSGVTEEVARGLGTAEAQAASAQQVTAEARHEDGQWKVLLRRALVTDDAEDLALEVGQAPPIAFQAWDGDHGERGTQGAISTWYFLALEPETPATVFVAPVAALFLTFGLGLFVVSRARKEEQARWTEQDKDAVAVATD